MNNDQYGAPQHELNVVSSLLRDNSTVNQLVDWNRSEPDYWLKRDHFQTAWLGDAYEALLSGGLGDIQQRLQAYPGADPAQATADAVTARMMTLYQQRAAAGDANAQWAADQAYYTHSLGLAGIWDLVGVLQRLDAPLELDAEVNVGAGAVEGGAVDARFAGEGLDVARSAGWDLAA